MTVSLDKLHTTVSYRQQVGTNPFDKLLLDKLHVTVSYRGPTVGFGEAAGSGEARAQSQVLLVRRPDTDTSKGGWKDQAGSATTLFPGVAKYFVDDSTYIEGEPGTAADTVKLKLELPTFEQGDEIYIEYRVSKQPVTSTTPVDITVQLVEGTTVIATWTHTNVGYDPVSYTQLLTDPQAASITDFNDLYLVMVSNPS